MFPNIYSTLKASSAVTAIVGSSPMRAYGHGNAPQDTEKPYIVYSVYSGSPENNLSDIADIDLYSLQIDCYHQTDSGVESLASAVRDSMEGIGYLTGVPIDEREQDTKLFRIAMQFDVWHSR